MDEIRKLAISYVQDFCALYGYYIKNSYYSLFDVVDTHDELAQAIVYTIDNNKYNKLKHLLNTIINCIDTKDDLYRLALKIANLV